MAVTESGGGAGTSRAVFFCLSVFGFFILLGASTINGLLEQLLLNMWNRRFSDGSLRYHVYTGFPMIDYLLAMPVSFWVPALKRFVAVKLQSVVLYPALQSLAAWASIEGLRRNREKPLMLRFAPLAVFVWMWLGTGVFMGLFCYYDLLFHYHDRPKKHDQSVNVPYRYAVLIPFATALAYIWPYVLIHFPPPGLTIAQHHQVIALNQLGSIFCHLLVTGGASCFSSSCSDQKLRTEKSDMPWIKCTYALFGTFSLVLHLATIGTILRSDDPTVSLSKVLVPKFAHMLGTERSKSVMMAPEVHFFLQWDFILFVVITALWGTRVVENMRSPTAGGWSCSIKAGLMAAFIGLGYLINPGTILCTILYLREGLLREYSEIDGEKKST
ncbi:hypothetical protein QQS21_006464 [Conoideocrella luteorostrata]|uniref:Uncharacterized protein n=1 Tax=Conoideocrella luteorostrata TaxID=1105319 RepID=A0AAJ0CQA9_9HYPO|nr:hypothetical protein QQS21_006464 [Conoideocrella luteorostrata]